MSRSTASADHAAATADRVRILLLALISALVVVALAVVLSQFGAWRGEVQRRTDREAVRAAAPTILAEVFSYDPKTVIADSRKARTLVSEEFAAANGPALSENRTGAKKWTVRTVGIGESGAGWVEAVAVAGVTDPTEPGIAEDRIVLARFVSRDGRWLLDSVELIR